LCGSSFGAPKTAKQAVAVELDHGAAVLVHQRRHALGRDEEGQRGDERGAASPIARDRRLPPALTLVI